MSTALFSIRRSGNAKRLHRGCKTPARGCKTWTTGCKPCGRDPPPSRRTRTQSAWRAPQGGSEDPKGKGLSLLGAPPKAWFSHRLQGSIVHVIGLTFSDSLARRRPWQKLSSMRASKQASTPARNQSIKQTSKQAIAQSINQSINRSHFGSRLKVLTQILSTLLRPALGFYGHKRHG